MSRERRDPVKSRVSARIFASVQGALPFHPVWSLVHNMVLPTSGVGLPTTGQFRKSLMGRPAGQHTPGYYSMKLFFQVVLDCSNLNLEMLTSYLLKPKKLSLGFAHS